MYLVDTNIWLERLLDQERSDEVGRFLGQMPSTEIVMTDFSFHSMCLIMKRLDKLDALSSFVNDVFVSSDVHVIHLEPDDTDQIIRAITRYNLDFDDAYQYAAVEKYDLELVTFDTDFDPTPRGRKTPVQVLESVKTKPNAQ